MVVLSEDLRIGFFQTKDQLFADWLALLKPKYLHFVILKFLVRTVLDHCDDSSEDEFDQYLSQLS